MKRLENAGKVREGAHAYYEQWHRCRLACQALKLVLAFHLAVFFPLPNGIGSQERAHVSLCCGTTVGRAGGGVIARTPSLHSSQFEGVTH